MPNCKNCGNEITYDQYNNYKGFCQNCKEFLLDQATQMETLSHTTCQMESCNNPVVSKCWKCFEDTCEEHSRSEAIRARSTSGSTTLRPVSLCISCA